MTKERIGYIDAIKGFAIFLMVMGHALACDQHRLAIWKLIYAFHMPLFLFVSGYLTGMHSVTNLPEFFHLIYRRVLSLLIPWVCANLFIRFCHGSFDFWQVDFWLGEVTYYWYLQVVFLFAVGFGVLQLISAQLKRKWWRMSFEVGMAALVLLLLIKYEYVYYTMGNRCAWFKLFEYWQLRFRLPYFFAGMFVARHMSLDKLMDVRVYTVCLVAFVLALGGGMSEHVGLFGWLVPWIGIYVSIYCFKTGCMSGNSCVWGEGLQKLGAATLPIYIFHYLFIPKLPHLLNWFAAQEQQFGGLAVSLFEIVYAGVVSFVIVVLCICLGRVFSGSCCINRFLFGGR